VEEEASGGTNATLAIPYQKILITPSGVLDLSSRVPGKQGCINAEESNNKALIPSCHALQWSV